MSNKKVLIPLLAKDNASLDRRTYSLKVKGMKNDVYFRDPVMIWMKRSDNKDYKYEDIVQNNVFHTHCKDSLLTSLQSVFFNEECSRTDLRLGFCSVTDSSEKLVKHLRRSIKIINSIEKEKKFDKSTLEIYTEDNVLLRNSGGKVMNRKPVKGLVVSIYKPGKEWFTYQHTLSLFISIARMSSSGIYEGIISYNGFKKRNKNLRDMVPYMSEIRTKDKLVLSSAAVWDLFIDNIRNIYTSADNRRFMEGNVPGTIGIYNLIKDSFINVKKYDKGDTLKRLHKEKGLSILPPGEDVDVMIKERLIYKTSDKSKASEKFSEVLIKKVRGK